MGVIGDGQDKLNAARSPRRPEADPRWPESHLRRQVAAAKSGEIPPGTAQQFSKSRGAGDRKSPAWSACTRTRRLQLRRQVEEMIKLHRLQRTGLLVRMLRRAWTVIEIGGAEDRDARSASAPPVILADALAGANGLTAVDGCSCRAGTLARSGSRAHRHRARSRPRCDAPDPRGHAASSGSGRNGWRGAPTTAIGAERLRPGLVARPTWTQARAPTSSRISFGSMKRTSSWTVRSSETSSAPRSRKK